MMSPRFLLMAGILSIAAFLGGAFTAERETSAGAFTAELHRLRAEIAEVSDARIATMVLADRVRWQQQRLETTLTQLLDVSEQLAAVRAETNRLRTELEKERNVAGTLQADRQPDVRQDAGRRPQRRPPPKPPVTARVTLPAVQRVACVS
jgi:hypothetical protein